MNKSKTSLFLMELIISILFFSIASAVCIQLFVRSHLLSNQTIDTNHAVMWSENIAELFMASNGDFDQLTAILSDTEGISDMQSFVSQSFDDKQQLSLYFNSDWGLIVSSDALDGSAYALTLQSYVNKQTAYGNIDVISIDSSDSSEPIYTLLVQKYIQKGSDL